jgi:hypothetical protein
MKDFFISYTKSDKAWAEWIAWQLEAAHYSVVIQAWDFGPGGNFVLDMQKAAKDCERTIAVLSADYLNSRFTQPEWAAAFAQDPTGEKKLVLPVRIGVCDPKGLLPQIIYIDLVGMAEPNARNALLTGVNRGRAKPDTAPQFPGTTPAPAFPPADPALKELARIRQRIANALIARKGTMRALIETLDGDPIPDDPPVRSQRLAECLTNIPLDRLVAVLNRAHHSLYEDTDALARKADEEVLLKVADITIPLQVDQAQLAGVKQHFADGRIALIRLPAATATVAEIIMAGVDNRATQFRDPPTELDDPWGEYAQPIPPERGLRTDANSLIASMREHLSMQFVPVNKRQQHAGNHVAIDKLVNAELQYRLEAQLEGKRYYLICDPPAVGEDTTLWDEAMKKLIETYPALAFIQLQQDDVDQEIKEATVTKAIRDMLWRAFEARSNNE